MIDYLVLVGSLLAIALYGIIRTRGKRNLHDYLRGKKQSWFVIGLSVMATQASAITFLSTPGQGFESGMGFIQNYFALPLALIIVAAFFLPIYRKLNVYTAYEYLGTRFDQKTRLLAAALFLVQRGLGAGITIYAPAIVLSTVFGWSLPLTIIASGTVVIIYTVAGGSDAVSHTQKYQIAVIFAGMITAFVILLQKIPCSFPDALALAGHFGKLNAVSFSVNPKERYTFWTGMLGGIFLMLSYFGADQSQVQRYISGDNLRESRLGLMFNAVFKIPMQFGILLLGVMLFVFYQFTPAPIFFNKAAYQQANTPPINYQSNMMPPPWTESYEWASLQGKMAYFEFTEGQKQYLIHEWVVAKNSGNTSLADATLERASANHRESTEIRQAAKDALHRLNPSVSTNDSDYVFITFILDNLPHGLIGLLVACFFAAALSSKAAELNALASTTTVDFYRNIIKPNASDAHHVIASKLFTVAWGILAIAFALFAHLSENLIQAVNILGSVFYGVVLGIFLVAFFIRYVKGSAVFWGAVIAQCLVFAFWALNFFAIIDISYLWYNLIGCGACVGLSLFIQPLFHRTEPRGFPVMTEDSKP